MMKKMSQSSRLALRLKESLASSPVKAGMRLLPERELAKSLKCGHKCMHNALQLMNAEGLLAKRHGSGNYVRKIPSRSNFSSGEALIDISKLFPESEISGDNVTPLTSLPQQQRLKILLCSGFHFPDSDNYSLWLKIKECVENAGHEIIAESMFNKSGEVISMRELSEDLKKTGADGYLVTSPLGELFVDAYKNAFSTPPQNAIYISSWGYYVSFEPTVRQDGYEATIRAVRKLAEFGAKKIAYIGIDTKFHQASTDYHIYDCAMRMENLDYRCARHIPMSKDAAFQATLDIFKTENPPDAIFVGDDHLVDGVDAALATLGIKLGRDISGITISNVDGGSHINIDWTNIEFNKDLVGSIAASEMLKSLMIAGSEIRSISMLGKWRFKDTHCISK